LSTGELVAYCDYLSAHAPSLLADFDDAVRRARAEEE